MKDLPEGQCIDCDDRGECVCWTAQDQREWDADVSLAFDMLFDAADRGDISYSAIEKFLVADRP